MSTKLSGKKIVIFGGGGFIGSHLVKHLCGESCQIDIVSRASVSPSPLFFASEPGQIKVKKIKTFDQQSIDAQIYGCDIVFNLIGILAESKKAKFNFVHQKIPEMIANSVKKNKVKSFFFLFFTCYT